MKTKEELNTLKEEVETVSKKLHELSEEELEKVNGGVARKRVVAAQYNELYGCYGVSTKIHGVEDEGAIPPCR